MAFSRSGPGRPVAASLVPRRGLPCHSFSAARRVARRRRSRIPRETRRRPRPREGRRAPSPGALPRVRPPRTRILAALRSRARRLPVDGALRALRDGLRDRDGERAPDLRDVAGGDAPLCAVRGYGPAAAPSLHARDPRVRVLARVRVMRAGFAASRLTRPLAAHGAEAPGLASHVGNASELAAVPGLPPRHRRGPSS